MEKTKARHQKVARFINLFAFMFATLVALALPGFYFLHDYLEESGEIENLTAIQASAANTAIAQGLWKWPLQEQQLRTLISNLPPDNEDDVTNHSILDLNANVIATGNIIVLHATISEDMALYDDAKLVGYYRVERSLRETVLNTLAVAACGFFLALIMVFPLRVLPLRALREAFGTVEEEKEKALVTLKSIGDAVITTNAKLQVEYINPAAEQLAGWTTTEAAGKPIDSVFTALNEVTRKPAVHFIHQCIANSAIVKMDEHTILVRKTDDAEFHIKSSASPIFRSDGTLIGTIIVFHDVTDAKIKQDRLQHIAFHDELTNLPNRTLFQAKLSQAVDEADLTGKQVGIFFMDLDHFKMVNDNLGHDIGDQLLVLVARRLKHCIRKEDTIARLGGDEFTAVIKGLKSPQNAETIAANMISSLSIPFNINGHELYISTSIGIAIYPRDGQDIEMLLKRADNAMYEAKKLGRNTYKYMAPC